MLDLVKLNAVFQAMLERVAPNGWSNDDHTVNAIKETHQKLETVYVSGYSNIIETVQKIKDLDQFCMLSDLLPKIIERIRLCKQYDFYKGTPYAKNIWKKLDAINKEIVWDWGQIRNYNQSAEELDYEADCEYYEYPLYPEAIMMLKIYQTSYLNEDDCECVRSEIKIMVTCKTYYKEYDVASYDPKCYDKADLVEAVEEMLKKAVEEFKLD